MGNLADQGTRRLASVQPGVSAQVAVAALQFALPAHRQRLLASHRSRSPLDAFRPPDSVVAVRHPQDPASGLESFLPDPVVLVVIVQRLVLLPSGALSELPQASVLPVSQPAPVIYRLLAFLVLPALVHTDRTSRQVVLRPCLPLQVPVFYLRYPPFRVVLISIPRFQLIVIPDPRRPVIFVVLIPHLPSVSIPHFLQQPAPVLSVHVLRQLLFPHIHRLFPAQPVILKSVFHIASASRRVVLHLL